MGGSISAGADNDEMIDNLIKSQYIRTNVVEKVFRSVDRAFYFLAEYQHTAYRDLAWKQGNLHLSAPCIYSEVLEHLKLEPGHSFLNIGSGTGYLSTLAGLILGPYGTNHGVEVHADVVEYAYEKLEQFKKTCSGVDVFEFCEPVFVVGNAFNLNQDRRYDRIYCGAACPEAHQEHIKKFMKIGGILVLPCEDDLLKIIRTSEGTWEISSVLPVSFSTLQFPDKNVSTTISMPEPEPLRLQEICRSSVRSLLRNLVEAEEPELTQKRKYKQKGSSRKMYPEDNCVVIPVFEDPSGIESAFTIHSSRFDNFRPVAFERLIRNLARNYQNLNDNDYEAVSNVPAEDEDSTLNFESRENEAPTNGPTATEIVRARNSEKDFVSIDHAATIGDYIADADADADCATNSRVSKCNANTETDNDSGSSHSGNNVSNGDSGNNRQISEDDVVDDDDDDDDGSRNGCDTPSVVRDCNARQSRENSPDNCSDGSCCGGSSGSGSAENDRISNSDNNSDIGKGKGCRDDIGGDIDDHAEVGIVPGIDQVRDTDQRESSYDAQTGSKICATNLNVAVSDVANEKTDTVASAFASATVAAAAAAATSSRPRQIAIKLRKGRFATKIKATKKHCSAARNDFDRNACKQPASDGTEQSTRDHQPKKVLKREKLDSGISEESDDSKFSASNESSFAESTNDDPMDIDSEQDSDFTEGSSCDENSSDVERTDARDTSNSISLKYRTCMEKKIQSLPLPKAVKFYLNYGRDFLVSFQ